MAVRGFITAFRNIDTDHDDVISHEDLRRYAREKDMPEAFVNRWITLFDPDKTGSFTYKHFCKVIGLDKTNPQSPGPTTIKELVDYKCTLTQKQKMDVSKFIDNEYKVEDSSGSIQQLLIYMDKQHGPRWRSRVILDEQNIPAVDAVGKQVYAFSPDGGQHKYLIWKQKEKKSGGCCACFV
nr:tegumental protein [Hymenolepis microstoma]